MRSRGARYSTAITTIVASSSSGSAQQSVTACWIAIAVEAAVGLSARSRRLNESVNAKRSAAFRSPIYDSVGDEEQSLAGM